MAAPTPRESKIPVFGPTVQAGYEFNHGHPGMGVADLGLAVGDGMVLADPAAWGARAASDWIRRGFEKQFALSWTQRAVRGRLQTAGVVEKGQELHHGVIPHGGWGKAVPDWLKNSSWNLKPLDKALHRRIHTAFDGLPRLNPIERTWVGTPNHIKKTVGVAVGHAAMAAADHIEGRRHGR